MPTSPSSFSTTAHRVVEPSGFVGLEARMWLISDDLPAPRKPTTSVVGIFSDSGRGIALRFFFRIGEGKKSLPIQKKKKLFCKFSLFFLLHSSRFFDLEKKSSLSSSFLFSLFSLLFPPNRDGTSHHCFSRWRRRRRWPWSRWWRKRRNRRRWKRRTGILLWPRRRRSRRRQ